MKGYFTCLGMGKLRVSGFRFLDPFPLDFSRRILKTYSKNVTLSRQRSRSVSSWDARPAGKKYGITGRPQGSRGRPPFFDGLETEFRRFLPTAQTKGSITESDRGNVIFSFGFLFLVTEQG